MKNGYTPLMYLSESVDNKKSHELIKLLINYNVDINFQNKFQGRTALTIASEDNNKGIVELLLKHEANPNIQDNNKMTALLYACKCGNIECVELLLKHGADPKNYNIYGQTAYNISKTTEILQLMNNYNKLKYDNQPKDDNKRKIEELEEQLNIIMKKLQELK